MKLIWSGQNENEAINILDTLILSYVLDIKLDTWVWSSEKRCELETAI